MAWYGSSAWRYVLTWMGGMEEGEGGPRRRGSVYTDSLRRRAETNAALWRRYTQIKKKKKKDAFSDFIFLMWKGKEAIPQRGGSSAVITLLKTWSDLQVISLSTPQAALGC